MNVRTSGRRHVRWPLKGTFVVGLAVAASVLVGGCLSRPAAKSKPTTKTVISKTIRQGAIDKVDLLFTIDNSRSMGDKQELLAKAVPDLISRLIHPNCVDRETGEVVGQSRGGDCSGFGASTRPEFVPVYDMHVGIVSSSLGGRGSSQCPTDATNPTNLSLSAHNDDRGHLITRGGDDEHRIPEALAQEPGAVVDPNFLAWFSPVHDNIGKPPPPVTGLEDSARLGELFSDMIRGVHEYGCGYEAQLESWYRFLVQPDPYYAIEPDPENPNRRVYIDYDDVLLQQRHDFLRPDSLVAIIMVTDENDSTIDPMALGGYAWAYEETNFPNFVGLSNGRAPRATVECRTNPNDPSCESCLFLSEDDPSFPHRCPDGRYYASEKEDHPNLRFFQMKRRFGVDPQFPIERYVRALTKRWVPDRYGEHFGGSWAYTGEDHADCTNPLFAKELPTSANQDICHLPIGPRTPDLVFLAVIGGVPHQLLQEDPRDPNSPQKATLTEADWIRILGRDPLAYDFSGADPHMIESISPRPGLPPTTARDTEDPIHGREWITNGQDLQYACTFELETPRECGDNPELACDCTHGANTPLCNRAGGLPTQQIRGKAYPTVRELALARAIGKQAVVSSLCPIHTKEEIPNDPLYGYRPAMRAIIDRLKVFLDGECLPQPVVVGADGQVPCLLLEILPTMEMICTEKGLVRPDAEIENKLREALHREFLESGEADAAGAEDPSTLPICQIPQLVVPPGQTCADSPDVGWCYVTGVATSGCSQEVVFSPRGKPVVGARVIMQCIEQAALP